MSRRRHPSRAAARKGGLKTFRKYGRAHMARIGRKGHRKSCRRY